MLKDGVYEVDFGTIHGVSTGVFELRQGQISGLTARGMPISGVCRFDRDRNVVSYEIAFEIPPYFDAITGLSTGGEGRRVVAEGEITFGRGEKRFSFGFAGRAVDVAMRYVGPCPDAEPVDHLASCPVQPQSQSASSLPALFRRTASAVMSFYAPIPAIPATSAPTDR